MEENGVIAVTPYQRYGKTTNSDFQEIFPSLSIDIIQIKTRGKIHFFLHILNSCLNGR